MSVSNPCFLNKQIRCNVCIDGGIWSLADTGLKYSMMRSLAALVISTVICKASPRMVTFNGACDASAAVALDANTFVVADDEDNILRIYSLEKPGMPVAEFPLGRFLKTSTDKNPEADIEGCARVGERIYWITSHGRSKKGKWRRNRYLFFATKIIKDADTYRIEPDGVPSHALLAGLRAIPGINLSQSIGRIGADVGSYLAPKAKGLNIEALSASADGKVLYLGLRNPVPDGKALLIPLENAPGVVDKGETPRFGIPLKLDFGGLGLRSMDYSPHLKTYLAIAGASNSGQTSAFFTWSGKAGEKPVLLKSAATLNPEAIAPLPDAARAQIFSDDGTVMYQVSRSESIEPLEDGMCACKHLKDPRRKAFRSFSMEF